MTRVYERPGLGPGVTRALVIGVGAYPSAKPQFANNATPKPLRNVKDLQSAATGAVLFADWLIANADTITPPLASVDVLLNVKVGPQVASAYAWAGRISNPAVGVDPRQDGAVDEPTTANVKAAGIRWRTELEAGQGDSAILYICGHGAALGPDNVVFLSDLNSDPASPWGALLNIQQHASALKQMSGLGGACFFVDACSEAIAQLPSVPGTGAQFAYANPDLASVEKVAILAAAAPKKLTYEGTVPEGNIVAGRFTQCILQALRGAAVRDMSGAGVQWVVHSHSLFEAIKPLYQLRREWADRHFDPVPPMLPAERRPLVSFAAPPKVPIRVRFVPPRNEDWALELIDYQQAAIANRPKGPPVDWLTAAPASLWPHTLRGVSDTGNIERNVTTIQGVFDHVV